MMKRVVIESPYRGDIERNLIYARRAMKVCLSLGYSPLASHLLYTQVLNDTDPNQRKLGMRASWEWIRQADLVIFFTDYGITEGMQQALDLCELMDIKTSSMTIGKND